MSVGGDAVPELERCWSWTSRFPSQLWANWPEGVIRLARRQRGCP